MSAITTMIIVLFESLASCTCTPLLLVVLGTKRKLSKPSKVDQSEESLPPFSNLGLILSRYFLNPFKAVYLISLLIHSSIS